MAIFSFIYEARELEKSQIVLMTLTGIGDPAFNYENVSQFLSQLCKRYKNVTVTLSSCFWSWERLERTEQLARNIHFRNIQITYVGENREKVAKLIPPYQERGETLSAIAAYIKGSKLDCYRLNYIMIDGVNDSQREFEILSKQLAEVKRKISIRISKLNPTLASRRNGLKPSSMERMKQCKDFLTKEGFRCYLFYSEQDDQMNCGQLITERTQEKRGTMYTFIGAECLAANALIKA